MLAPPGQLRRRHRGRADAAARRAHELRRRRRRLHRQPRRGALRARVPDAAGQPLPDQSRRASAASALTLFEQSSYGSRELGNDWTGNSVYLWAVVNAVYMALLGPAGFAELGELILLRSHYAAPATRRDPGRGRSAGAASSRSSSSTSTAPAGPSPRSTPGCASAGSSAAATSRRVSRSSARRPCTASPRSTRRQTSTASVDALDGGAGMSTADLRRYHAAVWDEPLVHGDGSRRAAAGCCIPEAERTSARRRRSAERWSPQRRAAARCPQLPELTEFEVQRHYLHLSQETLGMMGISLFGTCTMKYNPRVNERLAARPWSPSSTRTRTRTRCRACSRSIARLRPDPARAVRHGPVRLPAGRRRRRRLHARLRHPRLPRSPRRARAARRGHHDDPGAPVQRRDRRGRRVQGDHAAARGGRLSVAGRAARRPSATAPRR